MAGPIDKNIPGFYPFPVNNDRTAWRPFGLPVILVVPHRRAPDGLARPNSGVFNVRIFIEDVPQKVRVAGHQNIGLLFPDREIYAETVDSLELADRKIDLLDLEFTRAGVPITAGEVTDGDIFTYTTASGVTDTLELVTSADYYDLSDFQLETELLPSDIYNLVYEAKYFRQS